MAYSFDGVNDKIDFGTDPSIDNFSTLTVSMWVSLGATTFQYLFGKAGAAADGWGVYVINGAGGDLQMYFGWSGSSGSAAVWLTDTNLGTGVLHHLAMTYNRNSTANDPVFYADGVSVIVVETVAPSGSSANDQNRSFMLGETDIGSWDVTATMGFVSYDNTVWSADDVNRARWWGTRGGGVKCFYPLLTDANNRGSATANGTVTGAVKTSLPRVERNWGSMMGCGR